MINETDQKQAKVEKKTVTNLDKEGCQIEEEKEEKTEINDDIDKKSNDAVFDPSYIRRLLVEIENNGTKEALSLLEWQDRSSINYIGSYGLCLLQWASYHGNEKVVEALLSCNAASEYKMAGLQYKMNKDISELKNSIGTATSLNVVNTPLHRSAQHGHLTVCWLLIVSGFSTDDIDIVGNTPLHLAAANGHFDVVSFLIDIGADPHWKNRFDLTALDVTSSNQCRDFLRKFLLEPRKRSEEREHMRRQQIEKYILKEKEILQHIDNINAGEYEGPIEDFETSLTTAQQFGILPEVIEQGRKSVKGYIFSCDVKKKIDLLKNNRPVTTPTHYEYVNQLKEKLKTAESAEENFGFTFALKPAIEEGNSLCRITCAEYWLHNATRRLNRITCASEDDIKSMEKLMDNIKKAEMAEGCDENLLKVASNLHTRLTSEINLLRACENIPWARLPIPGMTVKECKDYWKPEDKGHIVQNEDYPFPAQETNEYEWEASITLSSLRKALHVIEEAKNAAVEIESNEELISRSKIIIEKITNDVSLLEVKDAQDYQSEVVEAKKTMKKLKKGKKKK